MSTRAALALALTTAALGNLGCSYYRWEQKPVHVIPAPADVLVVPGIRLTDDGLGTFVLHNRMAMAIQLLRQGRARRLLVTGGNPKAGVTEAAKMISLAVEMGADPDEIIAEPFATSTVENAENTAALMQAFGWSSALLVTDRVHLGYALPVFRDHFEPAELALYWAPVDYEYLKRRGLMRFPGDPPR
ncbi:MAG: YdcF family protein [Myxococcales bacterium]|nr:YdcF family protein [Myxococcales bacterium]MCB9644983.1 YdcF family protein [Deltaproteobacteria bacterium]